MVDRPETQLKGKDIKYLKWGVYDVEVSTNDKVTLDDYDSTVVLKQAWMAQKSDGDKVDCSAVLNVVTVDEAGLSDEKCLLFAIGVKA